MLGKVLQSESSYWQIADSLQAQHFSREINQRIYGAVRDILTEGKKLSLSLIQSRIGEEYDDGQSTMILMTALLRDSEEVADWTAEVETVIDLWRHRRLIQTLEDGLKEAKKPGVMPADLLSDMEVRIQDISVNSHAEPIKWIGGIAERVMVRSVRTQQTGEVPGFDTGLPSLDGILGRIHEGDLGFIGARSGDAKTLLALQLAVRAEMYAPCLFFELEMKDEDLTARVLAGGANTSVADIESGAYDFDTLESLRQAKERLKGKRIAVDDRPKLAIEQIRDRCIQVKRRHGLGTVVVDHLRLVRTLAKMPNKFDRMEFVTGELKALAKDLRVAIILLSQVTRSSQRREDPFPTLNDVDGGGALEQDADWGVSLLRRDRYLKNQRPVDPESKDFRDWAEDMRRWKDRIEIRCLKRRRGEDGETREFEFDGRRGLIREIEK